jgi:hypothetical protein
LTGGAAPARAYLTIRRITETHHGRTLLMLGHAAEHLANSRRFQVEEIDASEAEAMHILMGLSRSVFDEFAERATGRNGGSNSGWLGGYLNCSDSCAGDEEMRYVGVTC